MAIITLTAAPDVDGTGVVEQLVIIMRMCNEFVHCVDILFLYLSLHKN